MTDPVDPDSRPDVPSAAPPVQLVEAFLDVNRATLIWKASGLSYEQLTTSVVPSATSLLSIVQHCMFVERYWFQWIFAGREVDIPWLSGETDADWRLDSSQPAADVIEAYRRECAISREIVKGRNWDEFAERATRRDFRPSLGWVLTHMVEEVARHVGQTDIFREQIDGAVGE